MGSGVPAGSMAGIGEGTHGLGADTRLLDQLRQNMDTSGTLDVLRNGIELFPVKSKIALAQFRPASGINAAIMTRYAANRLRVVRQVRYSEGNENCLDLVFFLNGLPVATVELKSDFTQSVKDAVDQYRFDRHPQPKGQKAESLLSFPGGALVHFAVSNSEAQMTTRLAGPATRFLPFNKGDNGAAGNPPSPPATAPAICGKRFGDARAFSTSWVATSSPKKTTRRS